MPDAVPAPPAERPFARGSRTVRQAQAETGLSRQELWELMDAGAVRWMPHRGRGTRLLSWGDLTDYLDGLYEEHLKTAGAGART